MTIKSVIGSYFILVRFSRAAIYVIKIPIYMIYFHLINFSQYIDLDINVIVCEYLGLLESLRHLMVDLSREKHIKNLILLVTIEIGTFRLSVIISTNF